LVYHYFSTLGGVPFITVTAVTITVGLWRPNVELRREDDDDDGHEDGSVDGDMDHDESQDRGSRRRLGGWQGRRRRRRVLLVTLIIVFVFIMVLGSSSHLYLGLQELHLSLHSSQPRVQVR